MITPTTPDTRRDAEADTRRVMRPPEELGDTLHFEDDHRMGDPCSECGCAPITDKAEAEAFIQATIAPRAEREK